ncbi:Myosin 10A, isoform D [Kappamyces sp. JEL0680]|nr:Myosin 10A, isoform D [Kappamyces sp. JEL0680]
MSNPHIEQISQPEARPKSRIDKIIGFTSDPTLPRSSHSIAISESGGSHSNLSFDAEKARESLASEISVATDALFSDMSLYTRLMIQKLSALDSTASLYQSAAFKTGNKLVKGLQLMTADNAAQSQLQLLQLYSLVSALSLQGKKLAVQLEQVEELRVQLNAAMGIPEEKVATHSKLSHSPSNVLHEVDFRPSMSVRASTIEETKPQAAPIKLFSKLPKQIVESGLEKPELMRLSAVYELIETEIDYCKDLQTMIGYHRVQVKEVCGENDAALIFSNIDQLLLANQALANKMIAKKDANLFISEVGDLLIDSAESFYVYSTYASNYPAAMKLVHSYQTKPDLKDALQKWMNAPEARGLSLESFLIKPVQRICKYPLLIRELEKYSEKAGNQKDKDLLRTAAEKIEKVVTSVNEATRAAEEKQRILHLGDSIEAPEPMHLEDKVYVKDGMIQRIQNGKPKDRYIILYTDLLLICEPIVKQPPARGPPKYELECGYSLAELTLLSNAKGSPRTRLRADSVKGLKSTNIIALNVITGDKDTIVFMTNTAEECAKWLEIFQNAMKDITEEHRSAVRSIQAQAKHTERQSSMPSMGAVGAMVGNMEMFGKGTFGKGKGQKSGLSSIALQRAATRKSQLDWMVRGRVLTPACRVQRSGRAGRRQDRWSHLQARAFFHRDSLLLVRSAASYRSSLAEKKSIWKLPNDWLFPDEDAVVAEEAPAAQAASRTAASNLSSGTSGTSEAEDDSIALDMVDGFSNWRKVDRGDEPPYYFHIVTQETRWEPPVTN